MATNAAQDLLHATGNDERGEPWIQVAEQVSRALVDVAEHMQIADSFQRDWKDADWQGLSSRFKAVGMLIQVVNHGVEHRTNITTILAQQGIQPPSLDGWEYMRLNPDRMGA